MLGWIEQWNACVPGDGVGDHDGRPAATSVLHEPSSNVTVWLAESPLVHSIA